MNTKKLLSIAVVYAISNVCYAVDFVPLPLPSETANGGVTDRSSTLATTPDQVASLIRSNPAQAAKIVSDAIKANPSLAAEITEAAINAAPDSAPAITTAAVNAAVDAAKQAGTNPNVAAVAVTKAAINAAMKTGASTSAINEIQSAAVVAAPFAATEITSAVNFAVYNNLATFNFHRNPDIPAQTDLFDQQRRNVEEAFKQGLITKRQGAELIVLINAAQGGVNLPNRLSPS